MQGYETLTAPADAATQPNAKPDGLGPAAPVQQGDFAAGLRTHPHDAGAYGTFATGMSASLTPAARTIGDFASGPRASAGPLVIGAFATGMRARDHGQPRPNATDRPRSDRDRQQPIGRGCERRGGREVMASGAAADRVATAAGAVALVDAAARRPTAPPRPAAAPWRARRSPVAADPRSATQAARPTAPQRQPAPYDPWQSRHAPDAGGPPQRPAGPAAQRPPAHSPAATRPDRTRRRDVPAR